MVTQINDSLGVIFSSSGTKYFICSLNIVTGTLTSLMKTFSYKFFFAPPPPPPPPLLLSTDIFYSIFTVLFVCIHFLLQPWIAYSCMNFQPESCFPVAYSIHFLTLAAEELLIINKLLLSWFPLIGGRYITYIVLFNRSYLFQRKVLKKLFFFRISAIWLLIFK